MEELDVLVIGGGFAGLSAAQRLVETGLHVAVLEARPRVGGRAYTVRNAFDEPIDLGGQWVGPTHREVRALAKTHGQALVPTPHRGLGILRAGGRRGTFRDGSMLLPGRPLELLDLLRGMARLERLAKSVQPRRVWATKNALRHDEQSLAQWLDRNLKTKWARDTLSAALLTVFALELSKVSLLHALFYIASSGSLRFLIETSRGAQQDMFVQGAQALADAMATSLGARVRLDDPVVSIEQSAHHVQVRTQLRRYRAKRIVIAVPPTVLRQMAFDPWLPEPMLEQIEAYESGTVLKCVATYRRAFWRDSGWSGQSLQSEGLFSATFDTSKPHGQGATLSAFAFGDQARALNALDDAEREAMLRSGLVEIFGDAASDTLSLDAHSWLEDPWSNGGYAAMLGPTAWRRCRPTQTERWGRIHWAGTEYASVFNGYLEGAVRSGYAAAKEIRHLEIGQKHRG